MRGILSERNLVVVLFVMVLITFAFAHEDSKKMEKVYIGVNHSAASNLIVLQPSGKDKSIDPTTGHADPGKSE